MMKKLLPLLVLAWAMCARADVVVLNDGRRIEGDVKKSSDGWVIHLADGSSTDIKASEIRSIELKGAPLSPEKQLAFSFASLRRAIDNSSDPKQAIERYQKFMDQNPRTAQADEAKKEIAVWQERLDRKLIKWQSQWLTQDQIDERVRSATGEAEQARQLLKQGRIKDADAILLRVLADDPANPTALYLRGVSLYRQEQLGPAKKQFETVAQSLKDHAPTLNNLAVVLFRQKRYPEALNYFDQALLAAPMNKDILNNIAEALNDLPDSQKSGQVVQKVTRHFNEQDSRLQAELKPFGWFRWGSTWLTQPELERIQAQQKELEDKRNALTTEFENTKQRVQRIDRDIDDTERGLRRIEASSYVRDVNGNLVRIAYPPLYYDMQEDLNRLRLQRANELSKLDAIKAAAQELQKKGPTPQYSKIYRIIDVEGTPMLILPPPASQPSSRPSS